MFDEHARHGEGKVHTVADPHPGYGKDPNIMNEFGHTHYPKYVEHPTEKDEKGKPKRVVVENAKAEAELFGEEKEDKKPKGWNK